MSYPDWFVLVITLAVIILYGVYKSRTTRNLDGYFLSNREMPWYIVLFSIMGTQASAITFLSAPGQAYTDGMRFVQYYFGLPLAMIVLCVTFVPIFHNFRLYTAYQFLEKRFDVKTRTLTSFLFLLQRGLSTGISIYAPAIILSSLLGWNIYWTNIFMGGLLIIYTVAGGARAVAYTQQLQIVIIFASMFIAGWLVVKYLPEGVGLFDALKIGGAMGKTNVITTGVKEGGGFDWNDKYNLWSGIIGGFFLALSYFGTDQSQVGRYLTAKSIRESRMGLLMNGLVKVPMQFLILMLGVLIFAFYQFHDAPLFFNQTQVQKVSDSKYAGSLSEIQGHYQVVDLQKKQLVQSIAASGTTSISAENRTELSHINRQRDSLRTAFKGLVVKPEVGGDSNDANYIFLRFVLDYLPKGLIGLLIAVIFISSWGSIAAALNSLASSTIVDIHKKFINKDLDDAGDYRVARWYTLAWGVFCIIVAQFAYNLGNSLIEAVNILGSLFYGVILGVFLLAFYSKPVKGNAVFWGAILGEALVITLFLLNEHNIISLSFLWLNAIGALAVMLLGWTLQLFLFSRQAARQ
ncbi:sodium:solute symporter [Agriterribacter sp.]|uniref:sodium:solute symporter n=1 Tax=Agriterribacter sp. TaxID=2821509 RepID=UPI002C380DCB|nr:sodium:solute symporter [Agriterribacter sp.]HTN07707.1 sodium:solute symporter [Agriterribacter sp.]